MESNGKILVVDDEEDIRNLLKIFIERENYQFFEAENGDVALKKIEAIKDLDMVVLDIMMPGKSGIEVCEEIRKISSVPVLFLTAKAQEPDKENAYSSGGDDFLSKPFTREEFLRKMNALVRRYKIYKGKSVSDSEIMTIKDLMVDIDRRVVTKKGEQIKLTEKEFFLLSFMLKHKGVTWSLKDLYENIWGEQYLPTSSNTVMVHIVRLRQKIETDVSNPTIIRTVYGKGYQID